jgi:tetratricopeptide (TPR) repeat protein
MRQQLSAFFGDDLEKAASAAPTHQLSAADVARLRSLGYLASGAEVPAQTSRPHPRDMIARQNEVNAALSLEREQGLDAVIRRLQQIDERYPDQVSVHIYLAAAWLKKGDLEKAEAAYARCMELRPGEVTTYMLLAHLKNRQRKPDDAAILFEQVLELSPEHFEALDQLGRMRLAQGRFDEAVDLLTRALEVRPRDEALPDALASALLSIERGDDAVSLFQRLLASDPQLPMVRNTLAGILRDRGQADEAVALLREGIEIAPHDYMFVNNLAFILSTTPGGESYRPMEAALMMERVCKETGYKDPRYLHTLSLIYATRLRLDEAIAMAEKARSIASASDDPRFSLLAPAIGQSLQRYRAMKEQGLLPTSPQQPAAPATPPGTVPPSGGEADPP